MTPIKTHYDKSKNVLLLQILQITCLCWLLAKLMSWRLWTTNRLLPTAPLFELLDKVPAAVHTILFMLSGLLLLFIFFKANRFLLIVLLIVEIFSCLLDQSRITPWEYMYLFIFFVFVINTSNPERIPALVGLILFSTYFYGSLCKFNEGFLHAVWDNTILRQFLKIPVSFIAQRWVHYGGYIAVSVTELLPGIGLLFAKTQLRSAIGLIVMHLFILLMFGSLGLMEYRILWPWNTSMILLLYFVFISKNERISIFPAVIKGWNKLVLVCWTILPALSFWGYWDKNLSSNLFSANVPQMFICVTDTSNCKQLQRFCSKRDLVNTCHGLAKINVQYWAITETGVPAYLDIRIYKILQKKLEKQYDAAGFNFVYLPR